MSDFDCLVIGAGPGGYVCAIRLAQLGFRTAIVESRSGGRLGGTCLNVGCIPSKALLDSSHHFHDAQHHLAEHGVRLAGVSLDVAAMMKRKMAVVDGLTAGIAGLMKKNKITVLSGRGELLGGGRVAVHGASGREEHAAAHIILATGSTPIALPSLPIDGQRIVTSDHAIAFEAVPRHLIIVGGGVIGLELGQVWARLGAKVSVVEALPQVCPFLDADIAKELVRPLAKLGLSFHLDTKVAGATATADGVTLQATAKDGSAVELAGDKVLVCVGRRPVIEGCGIDIAGVALTERKRVKVDAQFRTSVPGVYAIGDLIDGPMLAHKAEEEGVALAEMLAGQKPHLDHHLIPNVVYTHPEVATVGLTEAAAAKAGTPVRVGRFRFLANGRAKAAGDTDGLVKILADPVSDRVLGAAIVGPRASDLLAEIVAVMAFGGSSEDIARICHSHPTFSEAVKEAALDVLGRVLHS